MVWGGRAARAARPLRVPWGLSHSTISTHPHKQLYTAHLAEQPDNAAALASRAAAYMKLGQNKEALADASKACTLKDDLEVAHYRRGVAAFALEDFAQAKHAFARGRDLLAGGPEPGGRKYGTWLRKCEAELEDEELDLKFATTTTTTTSKAAAPPVIPVPAAKPKYQYYQTPTHVTVTLLAKGVKEEEATVSLEARHLKVALKDGTVLLDAPLFDGVVPGDSSHKFFATKVELKLKKATEGLPWTDLVGGGSEAAASTTPAGPMMMMQAVPVDVAAQSQPAKAPRPYASQKNWEQVEREITKELESEKPEGEQALNKLFQDIYAKGDEETRRAMIKSFQTSGGTVLSTNWGEVAKKDYENDEERKAPEGMEWRKWGV